MHASRRQSRFQNAGMPRGRDRTPGTCHVENAIVIVLAALPCLASFILSATCTITEIIHHPYPPCLSI